MRTMTAYSEGRPFIMRFQQPHGNLVHNFRVLVWRATVESYCSVILLASGASAALAWLVGMLRPKGLGALPAAVWLGLITMALICSAVIGFLEVTY
jgi:hypothetical protein